jgi:hypothetical protein
MQEAGENPKRHFDGSNVPTLQSFAFSLATLMDERHSSSTP